MTKLSNLILMSDSYLKKIGYLLTLRLVSSLSCKKKKVSKNLPNVVSFSAQFVEMPEKVGFSEDQILEFQECFYLFDTKGDAKIPVREHVRKLAKVFFYKYLLILTLLPQ